MKKPRSLRRFINLSHFGALAAAKSCDMGGQAVMEGVMMRGRSTWAVAVRKEDGTLAEHSEPVTSLVTRYPFLRYPVLRGIIGLYESMAIGMRALSYSANVAAKQEGEEISKKEMILTFMAAGAISIVVFFLSPLLLAWFLEDYFPNSAAFVFFEGVVRVGLLLAYIWGISRIPELRRVFEYHGAEHKTIHAFEAGRPLTPQEADRFSTLHPRCGTAFLLIVMVVSLFVFTVVGLPSLPWLIASRIIGIPLIIGLSYELIKFAARNMDKRWVRIAITPGLWLQRLTTRKPTLAQLEVAIAAFDQVWAVEQKTVPDTRIEVMA